MADNTSSYMLGVNNFTFGLSTMYFNFTDVSYHSVNSTDLYSIYAVRNYNKLDEGTGLK